MATQSEKHIQALGDFVVAFCKRNRTDYMNERIGRVQRSTYSHSSADNKDAEAGEALGIGRPVNLFEAMTHERSPLRAMLPVAESPVKGFYAALELLDAAKRIHRSPRRVGTAVYLPEDWAAVSDTAAGPVKVKAPLKSPEQVARDLDAYVAGK